MYCKRCVFCLLSACLLLVLAKLQGSVLVTAHAQLPD